MSSFETQDSDQLIPATRSRTGASSLETASATLHAFWMQASEAALAIADDGTIAQANPAAQGLLAGFGRVAGRHLNQLIEPGQDGGAAAPSTAAGWVAAFQPDGQTADARWVLRDRLGRVGRVGLRPSAVDLTAGPGGALVFLQRAGEGAPSEPDADTLAPALERMVRATTEAVVVIDVQQTIVHFNAGAEHLFGCSAEAVIGHALDVLLPPAARAAHAGHVRRCMAEGTAVRWMNDRSHVTGLKADGSTFEAEATILASELGASEPRASQSGRAPFCAVVLRDITERRRQEERLRESVAELKQARYAADMANRAKSEFLATMSHELRTPINAVIGFAQIMHSELHGPLGSPRYLAYAQDIQDSAGHLLTLVNDVLDVSRIEAGHVVLMRERVALDGLFAACERLIAPRAEAKGIRLSIDPGQVSSELFVDPRFMKQALVNLLANAVKFTPGGGRVRLSAGQTCCGQVRLRVADSGIGIPPDQLQRIFEPFVQADGSLSRRFEGSGLGLMLVRSLAELHGGTVAIDSAPDAGTTAEIRLPASTLVERGAGA